ncbi:unnamed protein product [Sphenostylis stenocarpa]|uniref:Uncharacterized protein n=1 Tax=Sphenostylis stenocarpa TaxID=92480 RepID=A0AA86T267_9FABA|nr:unnamed protein product [Sphenostylis stenocarpa]
MIFFYTGLSFRGKTVSDRVRDVTSRQNETFLPAKMRRCFPLLRGLVISKIRTIPIKEGFDLIGPISGFCYNYNVVSK